MTEPTDRDDRPITQSAANRLMILALDELPALRTQLNAAHTRIGKLASVEQAAAFYRAAEDDWWEYQSADENGTLDSLVIVAGNEEAEGERRRSLMLEMQTHLDAAHAALDEEDAK